MKTMQKNKGKGLALGICAAILGTVGVAWIPQTVAWAYAESYMDADGKMVTKVFQNGDTDTVTDETDEVTAAEAENAGKSATEDFFVTVVQDGQNTDDKTDIEIAQDSAQIRLGIWQTGIVIFIRH